MNTPTENSAHTPGPWYVENPAGLQLQHTPNKRETLWVLSAGAKSAPVASWTIPHDLLSEQEITQIRTNARLIATAPDLLAECRYALAAFQRNANPTAAIAGLEKVIAKAEGRA